MSGEVSSAWREEKLGTLAEIRRGASPRPISDPKWFSDIGPGWVRIADVTASSGKLLSTRQYLSEAGASKSVRIVPGELIMSICATIGVPIISGIDACIHDGFVVFKRISPDLDIGYLRHFLEAQTPEYEKLGQTGTQMNLNTDIIRNTPIHLPPLPEQRRIAEILSSVDETIQATQAVIEQTRKVKESVLQRLLTKGIGHTRFKQTEIGEIPEHWNLLNLGSLLADVDPAMRSGPFGSALLKEELVEDGIPLLGIDNVHVERFDRRFKRFVTPEKYQELRRYAVRTNDVMITIMGTVGRCCVVPDDVGPALSSKHVWTLTFDDARYLPDLLCWQLNFAPWALQEFMKSAQGGVMSAINSSVLRGVRVPVPPMSEQRHIHAVLMSFNNTIAAEEERLIALNASKAALMADLLTGRRRVSTNLLLAAE